jgi:hypothetical protein
MQDSQDKETSKDEVDSVQENTKKKKNIAGEVDVCVVGCRTKDRGYKDTHG